MGVAALMQPQYIATGPTPGGPSTAAGPVAPTNTVVIDGTPVRVVVIALAAAAALTALRLGGFRFNVGVSS